MDDLLNKYKDLYAKVDNNNNKKNIPNEDYVINLYFICVSLFLIFLTYKLINKK